LEAVDRFKYLGVFLTKDGRLNAASDQMASTFMGTIQRVRKAGSELHIWNRKHTMLWLFQTFALSAGLYGCQIWAAPYLSYTASCRTTAHANHVGFLKSLLDVKKATETHCVLRETGQKPIGSDALHGSGIAFSTQTTPCYSRSYKLIYALLTYKAAGRASFFTL
jgi:hypothetical protein